MFLDQTTAAQLGWHEVLEWLALEATTPQGQAFCRAARPLGQPDEIRRAQERWHQLAFLLDQGAAPPLQPIEDVSEDLSRARKQGVLEAASVLRVGRAMQVSSGVRNYLI